MKVIATALALFAVLSLVLLSTADTSSEAKPDQATANVTSTSSNATSEAVQVRSSNVTENASVEVDSSPKVKVDEMPSPVFPEKADKNETALQILLNKTNSADDSQATQLNTTVVLTQPEGSDNSSTAAEVPAAEVNSVNATSSASNSTANETSEEDYDEPEKNDAENIQDNAEQQQEQLEEEFGRNGSEKATIKLFEDPITSQPVLHSGHFALIFASTLIILSILAYVGLVLWRGKIEQRYGNGRQRLVTEDDYYNNNDVRYFGL